MFIVLKQLETALRAMKNYIDKFRPKYIRLEWDNEQNQPILNADLKNIVKMIEDGIEIIFIIPSNDIPDYNEFNYIRFIRKNTYGEIATYVFKGEFIFPWGEPKKEIELMIDHHIQDDIYNYTLSLDYGTKIYINGQLVESKDIQIDIPEKISDLQNDTEYITQNDITAPDWEAAEGEDGYILNKVPLVKGSGVGSVIGGNLDYNKAGGQHSTAIGAYTKATGQRSFAHGSMTHAKARYSHAEGCSFTFNIELTGEQGATVYTYSSPFVSSIVKPIKLGSASIIDGANIIDVIAIDDELKTITLSSTLSADSPISNKIYVLVLYSLASGLGSHSEGVSVASGAYAHSEGFSIAAGLYSHSLGYRTIANHKSQNVSGEFNVEDPSTAASNIKGNYVEIVGNGTEDYARSNARTLDWSGNQWLAGTLKIGGTGYSDSNAKEVATKEYVDTMLAQLEQTLIARFEPQD